MLEEKQAEKVETVRSKVEFKEPKIKMVALPSYIHGTININPILGKERGLKFGKGEAIECTAEEAKILKANKWGELQKEKK